MKIWLEMKPVNQVVKRLGLNEGGRAQRFHTNNVLRRIVKYMPYRTGALIKQTQISSPVNKPQIFVPGPAAQYLYHGFAMEGKAPKKVTDRPLKYTTTKNPQAGPYWDQRLVASEGDVMAQELKDFIRSGGTV